jgi:hypothetical protein
LLILLGILYILKNFDSKLMKDVRSIFIIEENFLIILSFFEEANGKSCFYLDSIAQTKNFKLFQNPYIYRLKALGFKDLTY